MAKKKKKVTRKKAVKKTVKPEMSSGVGKGIFIGLVTLVFKVFGLAFVVQGFILQFGSGILYKGLVHYAIGVLFMLVGHFLNKRL